MRCDPGLDFGGLLQRTVPACLQFRCDKPVCRIGGIILPERPVGAVAGCFEIAHQGFANLVAPAGGLRLCLSGGSDGARFDHLQQCLLDGIVNPQAAEGDATWFAVVEQAPPAGIARDVMVGPGIADRQLATAAPAPQQAREQGIAMLGRVTPKGVLSARRCRLAGMLSLTIMRIASARSQLT